MHVMERMGNLVVLALMMGVSHVTANDSFVSNGDAECTIPFSSVSVGSVDCQGNRDSQSAPGCHFGDRLSVTGSFELNQRVNRYVSAALELCYYGSMSTFYKPKRCKTHRRSIDLRDYAILEQEYEAEYTEEGYNYKGYYQDEQRQQWDEEAEQEAAEQAEEEETYLYAGLYSWTLDISMPRKSFMFDNGSELQVTVTFTPRENFVIPYYRAQTYYTADIDDSKYHAECYLSFDSVKVLGYGDNTYYYIAGVGIFMLGAATYVASKRKVICACDTLSRRKRKALLVEITAPPTTDLPAHLPGAGVRNVTEDVSLYSI